MAKKQRIDQELFDRLRASGLRKSVARQLASASKAANDRAPATLRRTVNDLSGVLRDLEKRVTGQVATRSQAARKAATTRKRTASKRSTAAKKGAATRARSTASRTTKSRTTKPRTTKSRTTKPRTTASRRRTGTTRARSR